MIKKRLLKSVKVIACIFAMMFCIMLWLMLTSAYKMYLPKNQLKAVKYAQNYYEQNYTKAIKYVRTRIMRWEDYTGLHYKYLIYFRLKEEPECVFSMDLDYDFDTEQCFLADDNYLHEAMHCRILEDSGIKIFYGNQLEIREKYAVKLNEETSMDDVKREGLIGIDVFLHNHSFVEEHMEDEAKWLFSCHKQLKEHGYQLRSIEYGETRHSDSRWPRIENLPENFTVDEAKKLLSEALKE